MDTYALVAALGADASAAVQGYRLDVMSEARGRGLRLVDDQATGPGRPDPLEICLTFLHCPGRPDLAGRTLRWCTAHGWSSSHRTASAALSHYAGSRAAALDLVPTAADVLNWAVTGFDGTSVPPPGVDLDNDPRAIRRLLTRIDLPLPRPGEPGEERTPVPRPRVHSGE